MVRYASYPSLEDRVVFVTGGGSGIGASVVEHLCAQRARVAFVDIQREASEALVARIAARGLPAPTFIPCDLRDIAALRAAVAQAEARLGAVRVLVNNAAHDERHAIEAVTPEYWDDRFAVNLRHQFFAAQAVVPAMAAAGRRLHHQLRLDVVAGGAGRHAGLPEREGRRRRAHPGPRPGSRAPGHPRQQHRARAGS